MVDVSDVYKYLESAKKDAEITEKTGYKAGSSLVAPQSLQDKITGKDNSTSWMALVIFLTIIFTIFAFSYILKPKVKPKK